MATLGDMPQEILHQILTLVDNPTDLRALLYIRETHDCAFALMRKTVVLNLASGDNFTKYVDGRISLAQLKQSAEQSLKCFDRFTSLLQNSEYARQFEQTKELQLRFMADTQFLFYSRQGAELDDLRAVYKFDDRSRWSRLFEALSRAVTNLDVLSSVHFPNTTSAFSTLAKSCTELKDIRIVGLSQKDSSVNIGQLRANHLDKLSLSRCVYRKGRLSPTISSLELKDPMTVMVIKPHQEKELHHSWAFPRLTTLILTLPRIKSYKSIEDLRPALQASKNTLQKFEVMGEGISIFGLKKLLSTFFRDSYPSLQVLSLPACPRSSKGSHTGNRPVSIIYDALEFIPMVLPVQEMVLTIGVASATPLASILQSLAANTQQDGKLPDLRLIKYVVSQDCLEGIRLEEKILPTRVDQPWGRLDNFRSWEEASEARWKVKSEYYRTMMAVIFLLHNGTVDSVRAALATGRPDVRIQVDVSELESMVAQEREFCATVNIVLES